jgi:hypothetical protein
VEGGFVPLLEETLSWQVGKRPKIKAHWCCHLFELWASPTTFVICKEVVNRLQYTGRPVRITCILCHVINHPLHVYIYMYICNMYIYIHIICSNTHVYIYIYTCTITHIFKVYIYTYIHIYIYIYMYIIHIIIYE